MLIQSPIFMKGLEVLCFFCLVCSDFKCKVKDLLFAALDKTTDTTARPSQGSLVKTSLAETTESAGMLRYFAQICLQMFTSFSQIYDVPRTL